jgi:SHS2 domain-containing protein
LSEETPKGVQFRELNHTADLRIEVYGTDEQDLFQNAIESLYVLLGLPRSPRCTEILPCGAVRVQGGDREEALIRLLSEILYLVNEEERQLLPKWVSVRAGSEKLRECEVEVKGHWRALSAEEVSEKREIKAVTYHDVEICPIEQGYAARVVMDI